jgi:RNA polymerase sigma-70 factor (ECF subfamily)
VKNPSSGPIDPRTLVLIRRARGGDQEAWSELFNRVRSRLLRFIQRRMHPSIRARFEAEDVLQMVHLEAVPEIDKLEFEAVPGAYYRWLCWKTRHCLARIARSLSEREEQVGTPADPDRTRLEERVPSAGFTPSVDMKATEFWQKVARVLDELGSPHREVFTLRILEKKSAQEVADRLGKSVQTVYNLLAETRQKLRERGLDR